MTSQQATTPRTVPTFLATQDELLQWIGPIPGFRFAFIEKPPYMDEPVMFPGEGVAVFSCQELHHEGIRIVQLILVAGKAYDVFNVVYLMLSPTELLTGTDSE